MGIAYELYRHASYEGRQSALDAAQDIQSSLEQCCEFGTKDEIAAASLLLAAVNSGIERINCGSDDWDDQCREAVSTRQEPYDFIVPPTNVWDE